MPDLKEAKALDRFVLIALLPVEVGASVLLGQTSQASKTKRVPVYERNSLAGISALAIS
jgi:hypothetical protein